MVFSVHIPDGVKLLIKQGQHADFTTPLYEIAKQEDFDIQIAQKLGVPPNTIFRYLKKFVGEEIKKGDTLATKKTFFSTKKIQSDAEGLIKEINHSYGSLRISASSTVKNQTKAFFKGEITEINDGTIRIKVKEGISYPIKKTNGQFGGAVFYVTRTTENALSAETCNMKIVVAESITPYTLSKCEALGVIGIILLQNPISEISLPVAQMKMIEDMKEIMKRRFSCCAVDEESGTITFYD